MDTGVLGRVTVSFWVRTPLSAMAKWTTDLLPWLAT